MRLGQGDKSSALFSVLSQSQRGRKSIMVVGGAVGECKFKPALEQ